MVKTNHAELMKWKIKKESEIEEAQSESSNEMYI